MSKLPVIEWLNPSEEDILWRYPVEEIPWGSVVVVHEYEVAVFFRDGKAYDVLGPGRHVISTLNIPILSRAYNLVYSTTPFKANIIFVSTKQFQGKFGGQTQTTDLAPLKYHGSFWFRVKDAVMFVTEVVGGQGAYDTTSVNNFLRGYFNENIMKYLARYSLAEVFTNLDRVSGEVKLELIDDFGRLGLELIDVKFEGVDTTPEYRDRLFWLKQTGQATYVLQMDTTKKVAQELGKSPGAAVGAGFAIIPPLMQPPSPAATQQPAPQAPAPAVGAGVATSAQQGIKCPKCGFANPPGAKFCMNCGTKLTKKCPKCGHENPPEAKFCLNCGTKLE